VFCETLANDGNTITEIDFKSALEVCYGLRSERRTLKKKYEVRLTTIHRVRVVTGVVVVRLVTHIFRGSQWRRVIYILYSTFPKSVCARTPFSDKTAPLERRTCCHREGREYITEKSLKPFEVA